MIKEVLFKGPTEFPVIRILIGCSYSGKTTYAQKLVASAPEDWVRVNRDSLRPMFSTNYSEEGYIFTPSVEKLVSDILEHSILKALEMGFNVVVDNTHLKPYFIRPLIDLAEGKAGVEFVFFYPPDMPTIKMRQHYRKHRVPLDFVQMQIEQFNDLMEFYEYNSQGTIPVPKKDYSTMKYPEQVINIIP